MLLKAECHESISLHDQPIALFNTALCSCVAAVIPCTGSVLYDLVFMSSCQEVTPCMMLMSLPPAPQPLQGPQMPLAYSVAFEMSFEDRSSTLPVILVYISITSSTVVSKWEVAS